MESYQTQQGRRTDLEAAVAELNPYLGAIGTQIMPINDVAAKTGTYYYQDLEADAAAQTGRAASAAPTEVVIGENSSTWSAAEVIKRYVWSRDSIKSMGGIARCDMIAAKAAARSVMRKHETDVATNTIGNASISVDDIEDSFIQTAQTALDSIHRYPGRKALICSYTIFHRIMRLTEVVNRFGLASASVGGTLAESIVGRRQDALKLALSSIIGVDDILIGDDDIWYDASAAYQDRAVIMALPEAEQFSEMTDAVFGKTFRYLPDGQDYPWYIESHYDEDDKTNKYDASIWYSMEVLNTGAAVILDGIDEGNVVTTTTTTA